MDVVVRQVNELAKVFNWNNEKATVLRNRFVANGFSDQRVIDAIAYVIDNYKYGKEPNIADFIQYDKQVEFFTYHQVLSKMNEDKNIFSSVVAVDLGTNEPLYIWKHEYELHKGLFKAWEVKKPKFIEKPVDEEK